MEKPARVDAKLKTEDAVIGATGGGLDKCFPPTPSVMINVMRTGIQARRSYLALMTDQSGSRKETQCTHQFSTL